MPSKKIIQEAEELLFPLFRAWEEIAYSNQVKVLKSFQKNKVREYHFHPSSGYGYGDSGRDLLEEIFAEIFHGEDSLVRPQLVSGTHAISACLFSLLEPGNELISAVGTPYDTLRNLIGPSSTSTKTLVDKGIRYKEIPLTKNLEMDPPRIIDAIQTSTKIVFIQRSRGYSLRPALTMLQIKNLTQQIKEKKRDCIVMVDNCYGEFTELQEPGDVGADITVGSLIKNPGGGLASAGGYITGKDYLIQQIAEYITAPGLGKNMGASLASKRLFYQGIFLAPHVVLQALKGACLLSFVFEKLGYVVSPRWFQPRGDIVQNVLLHNNSEMKLFAQTVQSSSPIDSDLTLEFSPLPGYKHKIIMAAGTFVQGSSIELSCDAPLREPYSVYFQGGLTYEHCRFLAAELYNVFKTGKKAGVG